METLINLWAFGAFICGLGYIAWILYKHRLAEKSRTWPATTGTITRSEFGSKSSQVGPSRTPNRIYNAHIEYRYMVGKKVYLGKTICAGGELNTSFKQRAEDRSAKYPKGSNVPVYYNPSNPQMCCLERRGEMTVFGLLMGGAMSLFGLLILLNIISPN